MKVIQLGCGITGLVCAEHLAKNEKVSELVLADSKTNAAAGLMTRLKNDKLSVTKVDATDEKSLRRLMKDADIVISSLSWVLNRKVIDTAISTGTNYVDFSLTLDWDEIEKPKKAYREADITILTCAGEDPGISDVFARYSADQLDHVDQIRIMDGDNGTAEGYDFFSFWSPSDLMDEVSTPAGIFKNGKMIRVAPLSERGIYEFPPPIGPLTVYNTDHEETYLMSKLIRGVKNVDFRIAIDDNFANIARALRQVGMHRRDQIDVKGEKVVPLDVLAALMPRPVDFVGKVKGDSGIVVETTGSLNGKKKMIKMWVTMSHEKAYELCRSNAIGYLVGIGGAIATDMIIANEISQKGLIFPEQIPAKRFLDRMREKGLEFHERIYDI